jgi:diguanylate cyclase (GGDEF)-like protein/putative nucleotidyltransferase with HDIG domain
MSQNRFRTLSLATRVYVGTVVIAGAATVIQSFYDLTVRPIGWNWAVLAVLTLVSGSATVRLPSLPATISVSEKFVFTSVLLFGSAAGTLTVALDALVISFWSYRKGHPFYKIVFNVCALPLTIWLAAHIFFIFPGIEPLISTSRDKTISLGTLIGPLLAFTIVYFSLNSWIITFAISLERDLRAFSIWKDNFLWLSLNYFGGASVAALLVSYTRDLDYTYLAVIVPLLVVLYFTFSMSMGRVEDANRHLTQLNALYMSTIETLAMAIDAKDQITHGHIRRVQTYAVALAKEVGVSDVALIRAVEAAALLHDMGKLAVPEYILNKPGPLTPAEFEKMKLHASVGADILSSIDFPYPVVPIVRHHHENWDGTGYPDRLRGTNIPMGARILAVVDCFDALTSDRPYRPRLTDSDALTILRERRGSMYDPLVVDTFIRVFKIIVPSTPVGDDNASLTAIAEASVTSPRNLTQTRSLEEIAGSTEEMLTLFDLARGLNSPTDLRDVGEVISKHVKRLIPCSLCVFFVYDVDNDELVAAHASGENGALISGLRIGLGQRLSGWVAANRRSIRNSVPVLDFGEAGRGIAPRPRSCLSAPVLAEKELIGVLTLYSTSQNAFSEEHQRVLEVVARQIAPIIKRTTGMSKERQLGTRDQLTGLPTLADIQFLSESMAGLLQAKPTSVLLIDVHNFLAINERYGTSLNDQVLGRVVSIVRNNLRASDLFFRHGNDSFIAILVHTDVTVAETVAARIRLAGSESELSPKPQFTIGVAALTLDAKDSAVDRAVEQLVQEMKQTRQSWGPGQDPSVESIH